MTLKAHFGKKSVDLLKIKSTEDYQVLNGYKKEERESAAKEIVEKFTHHEIMPLIINFSFLCFDLKNYEFIRKGSSDFLAELMKAYVDKYDGVRLAEVFDRKNIRSLQEFKFSPGTVETVIPQ